jgi:hypothetical protein
MPLKANYPAIVWTMRPLYTIVSAGRPIVTAKKGARLRITMSCNAGIAKTQIKLTANREFGDGAARLRYYAGECVTARDKNGSLFNG